MILRISNLAPALLVAAGSNPSLAFQSQIQSQIRRNSRSQRLQPPRQLQASLAPAPSMPSALQMSSIPDDNDEANNRNPMNFFVLDEFTKTKLPPAPEDPIALGGDVVALFVYSYLDHTINEVYADTAAKVDNVADLVSTYDPATGLAAPSLPVWFDTQHLQTFGHNWLAEPVASVPPYAPAIAHSGLAFVAIATSWIFCGYLSGAFLHRNTLECPPEKALEVTLKTWCGTCILMVALALGSDALWGWLDGNFNALSAPARGGLTKADADFIFDSLTVLAFWRFMFNWLLGYRR